MRRRDEFASLIAGLTVMVIFFASYYHMSTYSDLVSLVVVYCLGLYLGSMEILRYDFVLMKDPRGGSNFLRRHPVATWFLRGVGIVTFLLFCIGFLLGDGLLIIGGLAVGGLEILIFLLLRFSSYARKVRRDSGRQTLSNELRRIVRAMALYLPLVTIMLVFDICLLLLFLFFLVPVEMLYSLLLFFLSGRLLALAVVVGVVLYAWFIEYPFWQGRSYWKREQLREFGTERRILLTRMEHVTVSRNSGRVTLEQLFEKVSLEFELARNGRSVDELRRVPSHPFGVFTALATLLIQFVLYFAFASLLELILGLFSA